MCLRIIAHLIYRSLACTHARTHHIYVCTYAQSLFSLMPSWSVTREDDQTLATHSLDDEKNEEAAVLQRVKERINKVLQSRLAGKRVRSTVAEDEWSRQKNEWS